MTKLFIICSILRMLSCGVFLPALFQMTQTGWDWRDVFRMPDFCIIHYLRNWCGVGKQMWHTTESNDHDPTGMTVLWENSAIENDRRFSGKIAIVKYRWKQSSVRTTVSYRFRWKFSANSTFRKTYDFPHYVPVVSEKPFSVSGSYFIVTRLPSKLFFQLYQILATWTRIFRTPPINL